MCGIFARIGVGQSPEAITSAIQRILNRGYDSMGFGGVAGDRSQIIIKSATDQQRSFQQWLIEMIKARGDIARATVVVAHTRWATHGANTVNNAHPHSDMSGRFLIVHNGIVENSRDIKEHLQNITFASDTDSEVLVQYIGKACEDGMSPIEAMRSLFNGVAHGTWAVVLLDTHDPDALYIARRGTPLLLGISNGGNVTVGSEQRVFGAGDSLFVVPEDFVGRITENETHHGDMLEIQNEHLDAPRKEEHEFWTELEILEQHEILKLVLNQPVPSVIDRLLSFDHLVIVGCGSSWHAALFGGKVLRRLKMFATVHVVDASDFELTDLPRSESVGFIFVSQSGETYDCIRVLRLVKRFLCVGIINVRGSLIARECDHVLYTECGVENGVAATKTFTAQVACLVNIAKVHSPQLLANLLLDQFRDNIDYLRKTAEGIAHIFDGHHTMILLGKALTHSISLEGALKIKEIAGVHAEAFPAGALKHGPFALLEKATPVLITILCQEHKQSLVSTCEEVHSRLASVLAITNCEDIRDRLSSCIDHVVFIRDTDEVSAALSSVVFYQWLAYFMAIRRGLNPDSPRNLAKTVTV